MRACKIGCGPGPLPPLVHTFPIKKIKRFEGKPKKLLFFPPLSGSVVLGLCVSRLRTALWQVRLSKAVCAPLAVVVAALAIVMRYPDLHAAVAALNFAVGFLAMG